MEPPRPAAVLPDFRRPRDERHRPVRRPEVGRVFVERADPHSGAERDEAGLEHEAPLPAGERLHVANIREFVDHAAQRGPQRDELLIVGGQRGGLASDQRREHRDRAHLERRHPSFVAGLADGLHDQSLLRTPCENSGTASIPENVS